MIKTIALVNNDNLSRDIVNLFMHEKNRKNTICESLYYANYTKLCDSSTSSCYRILYSPDVNVMTIHLSEFSNEMKKENIESFREFIEVLIFIQNI